MKKYHKHAMEQSMKSMHKTHMHHSDPIVGGESEAEGKVMGAGEHANMPKEVMMKNYPKANEFGPTVLDDTQGNIDKENRRSDEKARRYMSYQH